MSKNIVIIGGGPAGLGTASALLKSTPVLPSNYKIIVIDKRDFYWHVVAGLRAPLDDKLRNDATIPYDRVFKNHSQASILRAEVTSIDESAIHTNATGTDATIPYEILVLATGRIWSKELYLPESRTEAINTLKSQGEQIAAAKRIVIVGGGAAGIELAGEIAELYQGQKAKEVTLIHKGKALLNDVYPDKLRKSLRSQLKKLNVIIKTGISVPDGSQAGTVTLSSGETITCDLLFETTGGRANSDVLKTFDPAIVSSNGYVKVNNYFQVAGHPKVFAVGDIADLKEEKQVAKIDKHTSVLALNIVSLIKEGKPVKEYKGQQEILIVSVGRKGGAGVLFGFTIGRFFASTIKSKGLFVSQTRKKLGYA